VSKANKHIGFPKVVIFELVETQNEYPKFFIRIYERRALDAKIKSKNVYLYIKGTQAQQALQRNIRRAGQFKYC
jgi:hypothetical protein